MTVFRQEYIIYVVFPRFLLELLSQNRKCSSNQNWWLTSLRVNPFHTVGQLLCINLEKDSKLERGAVRGDIFCSASWIVLYVAEQVLLNSESSNLKMYHHELPCFFIATCHTKFQVSVDWVSTRIIWDNIFNTIVVQIPKVRFYIREKAYANYLEGF